MRKARDFSSTRRERRPGTEAVRALFLSALVLVLATCPAYAASSGDNTKNSAFEKFKRFIENPPAVDDMVFSYQGPLESRFNEDRKRWEKKPGPVLFIRVRWGPQYFLNLTSPVRQWVATPQFTESFEPKLGDILVRSGEDYWDIESKLNRVTYWKGKLEFPLDLINPVVQGYFVEAFPFFALMNMGPHFIPPGAIRWTGDRFRYRSEVFRDAITIEGELVRGTNGFPEKMLLRYLGRTVDGRYVVRYDFAANPPNFPEFLPAHFRSAVFHGNKELPDKDIRILSLSTGMNVSGSHEFRPETWMAENHPRLLVYTNHLLYSIEPNGYPRLVHRTGQDQKPTFVLAYANRYYYVTCGLLSCGFLVINLKIRKQKTTKENTAICNKK